MGVAAQEASAWDFLSTIKTVLEGTAHWLDRINPDEVSSLREGLEETLTAVRLGMPLVLREKTLATTNPIETPCA